MLIVNKPAGITINQFINQYKNENPNQKICFSGRLDPMARGEVILLFNDECKNIDKYKKLDKTYQFYIIPGFQTKSDDPLGIIEKMNTDINIDDVFNKINENINLGAFEQSFHSYSSKCVNGEPLWLLTKNNVEYTHPTHLVNIYECLINPVIQVNFNEWKNEIIKQIKTIDSKCDFNQVNIINQWSELELEKPLCCIPVTITVSSGFYVRQFVRDLSKMIDYPLMVYDINRVKYSNIE
jgi:tRNA pseudouridine(55) synthase